MDKSEDAFRTISEAAEELDLPQHVLRFLGDALSSDSPPEARGGRRYYRPDDVELLRAIQTLLYREGYTIKGVQRMLKERGVRAVLASQDDASAGEGAHFSLADGGSDSVPAVGHGDTARPLSADFGGELSLRAPSPSISQVDANSTEALAGKSIDNSGHYAPEESTPAQLPSSARAAAHYVSTSPVEAQDGRLMNAAAHYGPLTPVWTADHRKKLDRVLAELSECRRILSAAVI